jgi:hypothetical protein
MEKIERLRIDLARTRERITRATELGDWTARTIAEARADRLAVELAAACGWPAQKDGSTATPAVAGS